MTHKIIRKRTFGHDCDMKTLSMVVENEDLSTGSVLRCEKCGQLWFLERDIRESYKLTRISFLDYVHSIIFNRTWRPQ